MGSGKSSGASLNMLYVLTQSVGMLYPPLLNRALSQVHACSGVPLGGGQGGAADSSGPGAE